MNHINRILVGLELKEEDLKLIKYVKSLVSELKPKYIDFIHIADNLEVNLPDVGKFTPQDEKIEKIMKDEVSLFFDDNDCEAHFEVVEGKPVEKLLHWATIKKSDLIVLGRKKDKKHAEITLEKVVRKAPCSVMIVPENSNLGFSKILFPVDYSTKTIDGINLLNDIFDSPKIEGLHFFELPSGYYKTGKSEEDFIKIMDNNSKREAEQLISKLLHTENLSFKNVCSEQIDEFDYIVDYAKSHHSNVIAIGSRGRTNAAAVLLGSFAEKFIRHNREIPTFVFKEKGENMDFLKAFLEF